MTHSPADIPPPPRQTQPPRGGAVWWWIVVVIIVVILALWGWSWYSAREVVPMTVVPVEEETPAVAQPTPDPAATAPVTP